MIVDNRPRPRRGRHTSRLVQDGTVRDALGGRYKRHLSCCCCWCCCCYCCCCCCCWITFLKLALSLFSLYLSNKSFHLTICNVRFLVQLLYVSCQWALKFQKVFTGQTVQFNNGLCSVWRLFALMPRGRFTQTDSLKMQQIIWKFVNCTCLFPNVLNWFWDSRVLSFPENGENLRLLIISQWASFLEPAETKEVILQM